MAKEPFLGFPFAFIFGVSSFFLVFPFWWVKASVVDEHANLDGCFTSVSFLFASVNYIYNYLLGRLEDIVLSQETEKALGKYMKASEAIEETFKGSCQGLYGRPPDQPKIHCQYEPHAVKDFRTSTRKSLSEKYRSKRLRCRTWRVCRRR